MNGVDEDIPMEDLDDEAMFKADAHIGAMLRANKEKKREVKDTGRQLQHFQLRILDLLESYFRATAQKSHKQSSLLQYCIAPMIKAGKNAQVT